MDHQGDRRHHVTRELLALYLSGDSDAERELFEGHREWLARQARGHRLMNRLRGRLTEDDVVNEVFVRALAPGLLSNFRIEQAGALRALLRKILDCAMADKCREIDAKKRGAGVAQVSYDELDDDGDKPKPAVASTDPSPTSMVRSEELIELVRTRLNDREWRVWYAIEVESEDSRTVADRLSTTPEAIRGVLFRARSKILTALRSYLDPEE